MDTNAHARIVVGHDGSAGADHALEVSISLAERLKSSLDIVRTWSLDTHLPAVTQILGRSQSDEDVSATVRRDLESDTARVRDQHPAVPVELEVHRGSPAEVLVENSDGARLLVVGARGHGGFRGLTLGSVTIHLLQRSRGPVLIVPSPEHAAKTAADVLHDVPAGAEAEASSRPAPAGSIVVGHDGSPEADRALLEALSLADDLAVPLTVVRAWNIETAPRGSVWGEGGVSPHHEISRAVCEVLGTQVAPHAASHPSVSIEYRAMLGHPAEVLTRLSREALMLVVGRHGRGRLAGLVVGSVSAQSVHRATCPTLVVPHHEK